MEVAGTQLVEKDIENLARGERGRPLRDPTGGDPPGPSSRLGVFVLSAGVINSCD